MYNNPYNYYPYMNMTMNIPRGTIVNPYMQGNISNAIRPRGGFLKGLSNIKWGEVLNNTQKTLNVINQAIPVYYQVKPIYNNAKTMFRMVSALKDDDNDTKKNNLNNNNKTVKKEPSNNDDGPIFFL